MSHVAVPKGTMCRRWTACGTWRAPRLQYVRLPPRTVGLHEVHEGEVATLCPGLCLAVETTSVLLLLLRLQKRTTNDCDSDDDEEGVDGRRPNDDCEYKCACRCIGPRRLLLRRQQLLLFFVLPATAAYHSSVHG